MLMEGIPGVLLLKCFGGAEGSDLCNVAGGAAVLYQNPSNQAFKT
jgi:hypothetical protein